MHMEQVLACFIVLIQADHQRHFKMVRFYNEWQVTVAQNEILIEASPSGGVIRHSHNTNALVKYGQPCYCDSKKYSVLAKRNKIRVLQVRKLCRRSLVGKSKRFLATGLPLELY